MAYESPHRARRKEIQDTILKTSPSLLILLGSCGAFSGLLSRDGEEKLFVGASVGFGFLAAIVLVMYTFVLFASVIKKK